MRTRKRRYSRLSGMLADARLYELQPSSLYMAHALQSVPSWNSRSAAGTDQSTARIARFCAAVGVATVG